MATLTLPTLAGSSIYRVFTQLDEALFRFDMKFNSREGFWYFDLYDSEGTAIRHGVKVVSNWSLLRFVTSQLRPRGEIFAIDTSDTGRTAGRDELGASVPFVYEESASLETLLA